MSNDIRLIAEEVNSLNAMMDTDEYRNAVPSDKQKMIFAILDKFQAKANKKPKRKGVSA